MNRPFLFLALALTSLLLGLSPTTAQPCTVEPMPAATLLLPYFEVDLDNLSGSSTLVSVNNAATQPVLAKVEVWSDLGVPLFGFMIYLKALDVQTINLSDLLINGKLPQTAPPAGTFTSCAGAMPPANLSPGVIWNYNRALTGQSVDLLGGRCIGRNLHDRLARGYITVDAASACTTQIQSTPGVFSSGGNGVFTNQNFLWGDYYYTNAALNQAEGHPLVHIRADAANPETSLAGSYSFYGTFVSWTAIDNRVPLATNFAARYLNGPGYSTDLVVWRDSKVQTVPFTCGSLPSWYPLGVTRVTALDEQSNASAILVNPFPAVAQRVRVGSSALPVPYSFGWLSLDLNTFVAAAGSNPPADPIATQAWVTTSLTNGPLGLGTDVIRLDNACNARHSGL